MGTMSLGNLAPNLENIATARGAAASVYELIEMVSSLQSEIIVCFNVLTTLLHHDILIKNYSCFLYFFRSQKLIAVQRKAQSQKSQAMWNLKTLSSSTQPVQKSL